MKTVFFNWLLGKPPQKRSFVKSVFGKFIVGSMWIYIFYSFSSGPAAVFASINPIGFSTVYCGENVIHYTKDFQATIDCYVSLIKEARATVDSKWNEGDAVVSQRKPIIHFYLTSHAQHVSQLTMVNTAAVTVFGGCDNEV